MSKIEVILYRHPSGECPEGCGCDGLEDFLFRDCRMEVALVALVEMSLQGRSLPPGAEARWKGIAELGFNPATDLPLVATFPRGNFHSIFRDSTVRSKAEHPDDFERYFGVRPPAV